MYLAVVGLLGASAAEAATTNDHGSALQFDVAVPNGEIPDRLMMSFASGLDPLLRPEEWGATASGVSAQQVACLRSGRTTWRCAIPHGRWNLRWTASGFASALQLGVEVQAGEIHDLGRITMVRGASAIGRLIVPDELTPEEVEIRLVVDSSGSTIDDLLKARRSLLREEGVFQFHELPAGRYVISAHAVGWATARSGPFSVHDHTETVLPRPLEISRSSELELCLTPPSPPGVRRSTDGWIVRLTPEALDDPPALPCAEGDGCWRWVDLPQGSFTVQLEDGRSSLWLQRRIELPPGATKLTLNVPLIAIEGSIKRGGRPVRARVVFEKRGSGGSEEKASSQRIVLYSDPDGRFEAGLPEGGLWLVKAAFAASAPEAVVTTVDVERPVGGEAIRLELNVPGAG